jgi:TrmH family RNA methyltransferase
MSHESEANQFRDREQCLDDVRQLQSHRAYRDGRAAFFVEGVRNVIEAIESGSHLDALVYSDRLLTVPAARSLVRAQRRRGTFCRTVSPEEFRQISQTERASGVAAIVGQRWSKLHKVSPRAGLCWVALAEVRSPGNLGSLIRTAEAVGAAGFILMGPSIDPFEPAVVRASMGSLFRQQFVRSNAASLRNWVRRHGCHVVGATPDGSTEFQQFHYPGPTVLLLGEERMGLTIEQRQLAERLVCIPMVGRANSLNVAVAGSLLLYEVYRARAKQRVRRPAKGAGNTTFPPSDRA